MTANPKETKTADRPYCHLINLPAEIPNRIYKLAVPTDTKVDINRLSKPPALLCTCRKVRREVSGLYYETNTFYVQISVFKSWLASLHITNRQSIRRVRIYILFAEPIKQMGSKTLKTGLRGLDGLRADMLDLRLGGNLRLELAAVEKDPVRWVSDTWLVREIEDALSKRVSKNPRIRALSKGLANFPNPANLRSPTVLTSVDDTTKRITSSNF